MSQSEVSGLDDLSNYSFDLDNNEIEQIKREYIQEEKEEAKKDEEMFKKQRRMEITDLLERYVIKDNIKIQENGRTYRLGDLDEPDR